MRTLNVFCLGWSAAFAILRPDALTLSCLGVCALFVGLSAWADRILAGDAEGGAR